MHRSIDYRSIDFRALKVKSKNRKITANIIKLRCVNEPIELKNSKFLKRISIVLMFLPEIILFSMNQPKTALKMGIRGFLMIRFSAETDELRV